MKLSLLDKSKNITLSREKSFSDSLRMGNKVFIVYSVYGFTKGNIPQINALFLFSKVQRYNINLHSVKCNRWGVNIIKFRSVAFWWSNLLRGSDFQNLEKWRINTFPSNPGRFQQTGKCWATVNLWRALRQMPEVWASSLSSHPLRTLPLQLGMAPSSLTIKILLAFPGPANPRGTFDSGNDDNDRLCFFNSK